MCLGKLHGDSVKSDFSTNIKKYRETCIKDVSVKWYWDGVKGALLVVIDRMYGLGKRPRKIKKHSGGMMVLVIELVRSINYGRSGNREKRVRRSI